MEKNSKKIYKLEAENEAIKRASDNFLMWVTSHPKKLVDSKPLIYWIDSYKSQFGKSWTK